MHDHFWLQGELTFSELFGTTAVSAVQTWWTGLPGGLGVFCCLSHASWYTAHSWTSSYRACIPQARAEVLGRQWRFFLCNCLLLWVAGFYCMVLLRTGGFQLMSSTGPFQTNIYVLLQLPNFFCIFLGLHWACGSLSWLPLSTKVPALLSAVVLVSLEPPLGKPDTLLNSALRMCKGLLLSYHLLCFYVVCLTAGILLSIKVFIGIKICFEKPIFMIS